VASTQKVVIVGGGHNALVAAFYLARAGLKPLVLERRGVVGGCAITDEFHPGFRCSALAHSTGPLRPEIVRNMRLDCEMIQPDPHVFAPSPDGRALLLHADPTKAAAEIAKVSKKDAQKYIEFGSALSRIAGVLEKFLSITPPTIEKPSADDLWNLLKAGRGFRSLGKKEMFRLLRWAPMAVADLVVEFFETELLRATLAVRGIFGTAMGPWSAGSSAVLLLRAAGDANPAGSITFPRGGLGALTQAMAAAARRAGAEIRTGAEVRQILIKDGAAKGVVLFSGEEIPARAVVSDADPKRTLLRLMDPLHLEPDFLVKMQHYRCEGTVAKVNLALDGLPVFRALEGTAAAGGWTMQRALAGRIHIGPEIGYLERAFDASKYGEFSPQPYLEATIPTLSDPSLAPAGKHVMSIYMQYAPFKLKNGDWASRRETLGQTVVRKLTEYAPNLPDLLLAGQVITPQDLEDTYGLTGGHIFHGELALDQLFTMRPLLDWARYRTPIRGLYLCGCGTHPGDGFTGASGANAAREILKDLR